MKRLLTILVLLFASLLYSQSKFDINNLIDRGGLMYAPNDDEPYTGKVFDFYENGQKKLDGSYRKGLMNDKWTYYYENGKIRAQGRFINGDGSYPDWIPDEYRIKYPPYGGRNGKWTGWYENGQKNDEGTWKDGNPNGKHIIWHENGQKLQELTYKNGKVEGLLTQWYEDGQKLLEGNYKDGKGEGLLTQWYENGGKKQEEIFKNGELVTRMEWEYYEDGKKKKEKNKFIVKFGNLNSERAAFAKSQSINKEILSNTSII